MKIGIDISQIVYKTGVSVYTENLVRNLVASDKSNDYLLFGGSLRRMGELRSFSGGLKGRVETRIFPFPPTLADLVWNKLHILPVEKMTGEIDVFHSSDWTQPPTYAFKVTTIHDLSPLIAPEATGRKILRNITGAHTRRLYWVKKEADIVIAVSNSTKEDIVKYLGISPYKIRVIYEAAEEVYSPKSKEIVEKVKAKFRIYGDYLLAVGVAPRKNLGRLIKAFESVKAQQKLKLVVAGRGKIEEGRGIIHLEDFSKADLAALYSGALALVYPSLYEGFGLPILEAFACDCPVVTSNLSSMPEIAGKAAVLVDPYDTNSIFEGVKIGIRKREELVKLGKERGKDFSWKKTAQETLGVYLEASQK